MKLDKRITIQNKQITQDNFGGEIISWKDYKIIWANICPKSLKNSVNYFKFETNITHIITVRFLNEIDINFRILYNDRIFNIKSIINIKEKNQYYEILCEELLL